MAFRNVRVPTDADRANRNPIVDSWNKSHDYAVRSFVQVIASAAGRPGVFSARRDRGPTGVWASCAQFRRRPPFGAGHDLGIVLEMPPTLIVVGSNSNPLLYSTGSTNCVPAALPTREDLR
jgi:hypothetical protein